MLLIKVNYVNFGFIGPARQKDQPFLAPAERLVRQRTPAVNFWRRSDFAAPIGFTRLLDSIGRSSHVDFVTRPRPAQIVLLIYLLHLTQRDPARV